MQSVSKYIIAIAVLGIVVGAIVFGFHTLRPNSSPNPSPEPVLPIEKTVEKKTEVYPLKKVIGTSSEGRSIELYTYGNGPVRLSFVGGIHGGYEWNSVLLAYKVIDYFTANPSIIPKNMTIDVIPSINPDGVFKVTHKEGRFTMSDVSTDKKVLASGRFNARDVDLNRNFDCNWSPKSMWQNRTVSGGTEAFSEPEAKTLRDYMLQVKPIGVVLWHSQADGVYASQCGKGGILPETLTLMNTYSKASGYPAVKTFDAYPTTGAADDWLSTVKIPAITVELKTHESLEWENNLKGITALIAHYK